MTYLSALSAPSAESTPDARDGRTAGRIGVDGKFLQVDGRRLLIKGVTYGTFAHDATGTQFPTPARVAADFALMAQHGINLVRTYTLPPATLLDDAERHGLRVMAGVPWTQHVGFLDDRRLTREIRRTVAAQVEQLVRHPAVLLVALGNEIPAPVVRWHGRHHIERFIETLYSEAKARAPGSLFTYVNYPPTEHLDLPFLDLVAFNVYLHREADLRAYVARLQVLAGGKPLLLSELGGDSIRHGLEGQAALTSMQVNAVLREGACGAVAFAWTDEWWRGGHAVDDWAFGLVDAARAPKPALGAVARTFADAPFPREERRSWPKISVVVCAYNAADTIDECLSSLDGLNYPDYEVVVVNDGSQDGTGDIARRHQRVTVIDVPNGGLSVARNLGIHRASGEIVAFTDADARADEDWLTHLVQPFLTSDVAGAGGPNVVPPEDPWMAQCVARAPGAPTHVLLDDRIAEHVPGCNMAFRRAVLLEVGGFNPIYLRAGDDVDLCWRVQARGWKIGFAASAVVWHHHRSSVRAYWQQQVGYGEGEQWLMPHHPDRFRNGRPVWRGHIYSALPLARELSKARVNTGPWGTAAFPSIYRREADSFTFLPHRTRWLAAAVSLLAIGPLVQWIWPHAVGPLMQVGGALGIAITLARCWSSALQPNISALAPIGGLPPAMSLALYRFTIGALHLVQPLARAWGRLRGLAAGVKTPQVRQVVVSAMTPSISDVAQTLTAVVGRWNERQFWSENGVESEAVLSGIRDRLQDCRAIRALDIDDGWQADRDLGAEIGRWTWFDVRILVEDHGSGRRLARVGERVRVTPLGILTLMAIVGTLVAAVVAAIDTLAAPLPYVAMSATMALAAHWVWRRASAVATVGRRISLALAERGLQPIPAVVPARPGEVLADADPKKATS